MATSQSHMCTCKDSVQLPPSEPPQRHKAESEGLREHVFRRESAPQPLKFISFEGRTSKKSEQRKEVRSHVMFNYRWQQSINTTPSWSDPVCSTCGGLIAHAGTEGQNATLQETHDQGFDTSLDASRSDPFDTVPVRMNRVSKLLFDHFTHFHVLIRVPSARNPLNNLWSAYMITDPALMDAGLVVSASHYSLITGNREVVSAAYFYHKAEAIRIINDRLSDARLASDDITMSAIAILTISESFDGSPTVATLHMDGLEQLLNIREKWATKEIPGLLQRLIILADSLSAKASGSANRFQLYGTRIRRVKTSLYTPSQCFRCGATRPYDEKEMFNDLRYLTDMLRDAEHGGKGENADADPAFIHGLEETEQNLYCLTHEGIAADGTPVNTGLSWKVLAIAGHLYLSLYLRQIPTESPIMEYYASNLMDALKLPFASTVRGEALSQQTLFWMLIIGGTATKVESKERKWFGRKLIEAGNGLGVRRWIDVRTIMKQFVWIDEERETKSKEFWTDVLSWEGSGLE